MCLKCDAQKGPKNEVCPMVGLFNKVQAEILKRHVSKHKYFRQIASMVDAELDFIKEFAPIEREVVCGICNYHGNCLVEEEVIKEV